ncbi:hypothetical protein HUO09_16855 [Vibrio sp. Y2-5]|uniref:hypothetical protein n=1 Tax=Vibrio sp. Y2-5 TaxID=2743977 RepID=UPI001660B270|nr:hypothetical protein [Vibrio sp. Y2-5]MBD0788025.1 hypothetical protein [Vibrio sp. Y2-5]
MAQLDFLSKLELGSVETQSKPRQRKTPREKAEVNPLNTLLPYLYREEHQEQVLKGMKLAKKPRAFVSWDLKNELHTMQICVYFIMVDDLRSCFYLNKQNLVEHLEWIIDDPDDDFSFVSCMESIGIDKKAEAYDVIESFLLDQVASADLIRSEVLKKMDNVDYESNLDIPETKSILELSKYVEMYDQNRRIIMACIDQYFS